MRSGNLKKGDPLNKTKKNHEYSNVFGNGRKKGIPWEHNVDISFGNRTGGWGEGRQCSHTRNPAPGMKRKKIKGVRAHIKEGAWLNKKDVLPEETNLPSDAAERQKSDEKHSKGKHGAHPSGHTTLYTNIVRWLDLGKRRREDEREGRNRWLTRRSPFKGKARIGSFRRKGNHPDFGIGELPRHFWQF